MMYRGVTAGEKAKGHGIKDFSRNQRWNINAVKRRHVFKIASSLRSMILLNHVHGKEIHQTQISSSPQGTPLGISVGSDLRVLTLEDRDGDLTTFTRISFKLCLTQPTELASSIVCLRDSVLQKVWFYPAISIQTSRKLLKF